MNLYLGTWPKPESSSRLPGWGSIIMKFPNKLGPAFFFFLFLKKDIQTPEQVKTVVRNPHS